MTSTPTSTTGPVTAVAPSGTSYINALLYVDRWGTGSGVVTITYSFPGSGSLWDSPYSSDNEPSTLSAFNATQQSLTAQILGFWEEVANIDFVQVADNASVVGDVRLANSGSLGGSSGWAYYPSTQPVGGDVWINPSYAYNTSPQQGNWGGLTLVHEIGHALGLKHSFEDGTVLPAAQDNQQYTVMSYTEHPTATIDPYAPQLYDIAAIQYIYGANTTTRAGDTPYQYSSSAEFLATIWDAGGIDTLDASNQSLAATIDLNAGAFSSVGIRDGGGAATNNLAIAFGVTIENATGGSGNDTITGNAAANLLEGQGGSDTLVGGAGDDTLIGGAGNDLLDGATGADTVSLTATSAGVTVDLLAGSATGAEVGTDTLVAIENATGGSGNDTITGNAAANVLEGQGGGDTLTGGAGNDTLSGGAGTDVFSFGASGNGVDLITDASTGDRIRIAGASLAGSVEVGSGDGLGANRVRVLASGGVTTLYVDTNGTPGADVTINLSGTYNPDQLSLSGTDIVIGTPVVPTLSLAGGWAAEGGGPLSFSVRLSTPSLSAITVRYQTTNDAATAGSDYSASSGTLTIPAGQTSATLAVGLIDDSVRESNERFYLLLDNPSGVTFAGGGSSLSAVGRILDEDGLAPSRMNQSSAGARGGGFHLAGGASIEGRTVAFASDAAGLATGTSAGIANIFVRDPVSAQTSAVSLGAGNTSANGNSWDPTPSADGRYLAFWSVASNLVANDTNASGDIFLRDLVSGTTSRLSLAADGAQADADSWAPALAAGGGHVAFASRASNLVSGDTNAREDIFVRAVGGTTVERVSVSSAGGQANGPSFHPSISADGRYVAFRSAASNLAAGDDNATLDVFVRDRTTGTTTLVSSTPAGQSANVYSEDPVISANGRYVAFASDASSLVANDGNAARDIFVRDLLLGTTVRVSVSSGGGDANSSSFWPTVSADGRYIAFASGASNLISGDTNGTFDVFVGDMTTGTTARASVAGDGSQLSAWSVNPVISLDGRFITFRSNATSLVAGGDSQQMDLYRVQNPLFTMPADAAGGDVGAAYDLGALSVTRTLADWLADYDPADVYQFSLSSTQTVTASLAGLIADAGLQLLDSSGTALATSESSGPQSEIIRTSLGAGTYFARAYANGGDTPYTLQLVLG